MDFNALLDTTSPLLFEWHELGYGAASLPSAQRVLQLAYGGAAPAGAGAGGVEDGDGEAWMDAAVGGLEGEEVGLGVLPLPATAEGLVVRVVEAAEGHGGQEAGGVGAGGLAPFALQLGARGAYGMPYDMLGVQQSVDKMLEAMQQGQAGRRQEREQQRQQLAEDAAEAGHDGPAAAAGASGPQGEQGHYLYGAPGAEAAEAQAEAQFAVLVGLGGPAAVGGGGGAGEAAHVAQAVREVEDIMWGGGEELGEGL